MKATDSTTAGGPVLSSSVISNASHDTPLWVPKLVANDLHPGGYPVPKLHKPRHRFAGRPRGTPVRMELTDVVLDLAVRCDRRAPAAVRDAIARLADGGWVLGDAMLVATELVTNAVLHSGADETDAIAVRIRRVSDELLISVSDPGRSGTDAHVVEGTRPLFGGHGLQVVAAIASRWGSERGDGYRVWAELPLVDDPA